MFLNKKKKEEAKQEEVKQEVKYNEVESEFIAQLHNSSSKLIANLDTSNNASIEFEIKRRCSYPAFLWQETLVNQFNIFGIMLGVIDKKMDMQQKEKKWEERFDRVYDDTKLQELSKLRLEVSEKLNNILARGHYDSDYEAIYNSIATYPSYCLFGEIYMEMREKETQLDLHMKFINAYNAGYSAAGSMNLAKIVEEYYSVVSEIDSHENENRKILQSVKIRNL